MALSVVVTRTLLGGAALELNAPSSGRVIVEAGPGRREVELFEATSPVVDGSVLVGTRAGTQTATLVIRVYGEDRAAVLDAIDEVTAAFDQREYALTVDVDGHEETWMCFAAEYTVGANGRWQAEHLNGGWQDLIVEVPRLPR